MGVFVAEAVLLFFFFFCYDISGAGGTGTKSPMLFLMTLQVCSSVLKQKWYFVYNDISGVGGIEGIILFLMIFQVWEVLKQKLVCFNYFSGIGVVIEAEAGIFFSIIFQVWAILKVKL